MNGSNLATPVRRRVRLVVAFAAIAAASALVLPAQPSLAVPAKVAAVSITSGGFSPAVTVVPVGTTVRWTNSDSAAHSLTGRVNYGGSISPGGTYQRRFSKPGEYPYADGTHPASTGTVVVTVGGSRVPKASGNALTYFRAVVNLTVREKWTYYDTATGQTTGVCDPQIGSGSRTEHLKVTFGKVMYSRLSSLHVEGMSEFDVHAKITAYKVAIKSDVATPSTPMVTCPGGSTAHETSQPNNCSANLAGKPLVLSLSWGPTSTDDSFLLTSSGPMIKFGPCEYANQIVGALVLVGVKRDVLPVNVVGYRVNYDELTTSRALPAEVAAVRAHRAFTVSRSVMLQFTTPCCEAFPYKNNGAPALIGAIHSFSAYLTIRFTPIG